MVFDALLRRASKAPAVSVDDQLPERRKQQRDRRSNSDRRSSVNPNFSGKSRRVQIVDRRRGERDRRKSSAQQAGQAQPHGTHYFRSLLMLTPRILRFWR